MEWYHELEKKIVPIAFDAAHKASSKVKYVQIEFENGSVSAVIPFGLRMPVDERESIKDAMRLALKPVVHDAASLQLRIRPEARYIYTRHLDGARQTPNVFGNLHEIPLFRIRLSELVGLRQVLQSLYERVHKVDYVATTALGGIPALLHLATRIEKEESPDDQNMLPTFHDELRRKFHLFPGLNWSGTDSEKQLLFDWLAGLPNSASVILFDTGTMGNAIRQMANLIRDRTSPSAPFGPTSITLVGVIDNAGAAIPPVSFPVVTASGTTNVEVIYQHVPRVLTEDCLQLLGCSSMRKEMMLLPLAANAVVELVDDEGSHLLSCGALGADSLLSSLLQLNRQQVRNASETSEFMHEAITFAVAHFSIGKEYDMLCNAVDCGLLGEKDGRIILARMEGKYRRSLAEDGLQEWDFNAKRLK